MANTDECAVLMTGKLPTYKQLGRVLLIALGALALLLLGFYFYYSPRLNKGLTTFVLFHPQKNRTLDRRIEIDGKVGKHYKISLPASGRAGEKPIVLDSILFLAQPEKGVIFYSQGVGSSINGMADRFKLAVLLSCGYSVFLYDPEGYGLSSGGCDIDHVMPDALAAYDFLTHDLKYQPHSVIAYGESFGGGVTSELQKLRPFKAIILESTFISPKRWADDQASFTVIYPDFLFMQPTFDNLVFLKGSHPPVLLIAAGQDKTMPLSHAETMAKEASQPFRFVNLPESEHARVKFIDRKTFAQAIEDFLAKYGAASGP
jgi:pimeloyl-ACP methyl ester carboxylesterase